MSDDSAPNAPVKPGPSEFSDPVVREAIKRATVWFTIGAILFLAWQLSQPLLLIFGGIVFASALDGGVRLLGRVLPIAHGLRLLIVSLAVTTFLVGTIYLMGVEIAVQFEQLRATLTVQGSRLLEWLGQYGLAPNTDNVGDIGRQLLGSLGQVTAVLGMALGGVTNLFLIIVIGLFVAIEPRLYERGVEWMMPARQRPSFRVTAARMGYTMRRLLMGRLFGMVFEGVFTWIVLSIGGVPMALLLGIITGVLAFLPNIGAFVSGVLTIAVGFSAGVDTGLWAIGTYFIVQTLDGYIVVPMVAKRTVDLAPALVMGAQLLFGALFGILGLALADPLLAMIKVALERRSEETGAAE